MTKNEQPPKLQMLEKKAYVTLPDTDPLIFYYLPYFGPLYRRRVEMALAHCAGGERILEVGYGSGVTFLNLAPKYKEIHGIDLFADADAVTQMWRQQGLETHLKQGDLLALPYPDNYFDTVLLISILEHVRAEDQAQAMREIHRVLKPGGQMVYGVPVERPLMVFAYRVLGYDIRQHHFSTQLDVSEAAGKYFTQAALKDLRSMMPFVGTIYQVGNFVKE